MTSSSHYITRRSLVKRNPKEKQEYDPHMARGYWMMKRLKGFLSVVCARALCRASLHQGPCFSAAYRNLKDGVLRTVSKVLTRVKPSLDLGIAQVRVALYEGSSVIEKTDQSRFGNSRNGSRTSYLFSSESYRSPSFSRMATTRSGRSDWM